MRLLFLLLLSVYSLPETLVARYSASKIVVDGQLDESAWENADTVDVILAPWGGGRGTRSRLMVLWDDSALYLGIIANDSSIVAVCSVGTAIDGDDMLEFHMSPDTMNDDYFYYLEHNLRSVRRQGIRHSRADGRNDWKVDWASSVDIDFAIQRGNINFAGWTEEARIPFSALDGWQAAGKTEPYGWNPSVPVADSSVWKFNICRQNQNVYSDPSSDWTIWNHNGNYPYGVSSPHLHDHNNFGTILFVKNNIAVESGMSVNRNLAIDISPTPFKSSFLVRGNGRPLSVSVYGLNGSKYHSLVPVYGKEGWHSLCSGQNMTAGIYIIRSDFENGSSSTAKALLVR